MGNLLGGFKRAKYKENVRSLSNAEPQHFCRAGEAWVLGSPAGPRKKRIKLWKFSRFQGSFIVEAINISRSPIFYSFDGKLLQVYDVLGALLKDYIYMGDRLIAEYDHVGGRLLYYTPDQINTTRVVTDQSGNVVYSAVHDPYGGIQQTNPGNTYDPLLKFSGKEHDAESELDYFGARYYDRSLYRFVSVDPQLGPTAAGPGGLSGNMYSYCGNNPVSYVDPDGYYAMYWADPKIVTREVPRYYVTGYYDNGAPQYFRGWGGSILHLTVSFAYDMGKPTIVVEVKGIIVMLERNNIWWRDSLAAYLRLRTWDKVWKHEERHIDDAYALLGNEIAKIEEEFRSGKIKSEAEAKEAIEAARKRVEKKSQGRRHKMDRLTNWLFGSGTFYLMEPYLTLEPYAGYFPR